MRPQMRNRAHTAAVFAAALATAAPVAAADWRITGVDGAAPVGDPQIAFASDGSFAGSTGCNRFQGTGRLETGQLVVAGPVATTRMACPGDVLTRQEDTILALFDGAIDIAFDPFAESLTLSRGATTLALAAAGSHDAAPPASDPDQPDSPPSDSLPSDPPAAAPLPLSEATFVTVVGVSDRLNVHAGPGIDAPVVTRVAAGTLFRNAGCRPGPAHDWCHLVALGASGVEGWAAAEYLEPARAEARAGAGVFERIGTLSCTDPTDTTVSRCDFGTARDGDGTSVVAVFRADGTRRLLTFVNGAFTGAGAGQSGAAASPGPGVTIVTIDGERYEIPQSLP